ncbi:hypothetical protein ACFQPF_16040 [Fictibacillus iocasae]|uniref:DUF1292 domain-containing protein n=1 Tax=Fictibacillus iocasae TaxID=2715437 RepID=A0ABW2NTG2_9BACL
MTHTLKLEEIKNNPEREWEFQRKDEPSVTVRLRFVPQGDEGYFQATFLDEEEDIVGSQVLDEFDDAIKFLERNHS